MKEEKEINIVLAILIIVIVILVFVASFGQVDVTLSSPSKKRVLPKYDLNKLQSRHKKLKALIEKKEALNIKLNKKFKRIYFGVRLVLASIYVGYNALLYFAFEITNLGDLLNWNQFALVVIALFSFIAFGTFANVKDFITTIKMRLESKTYDKYVDITEQLKNHKKEAMKLTATISRRNEQTTLSGHTVVEDSVMNQNRDIKLNQFKKYR
jgi:hypothetical protein